MKENLPYIIICVGLILLIGGGAFLKSGGICIAGLIIFGIGFLMTPAPSRPPR